MTSGDQTRLTYAAAGVDTEAGDRAVELMKAAVARTHGPNVVGGLGGFAGLIDVSDLKRYRRPLLASATDGVGTKVAIAQALDIHDTIGHDLVGMVVDDIVVCGAKPLAMTDYIATGRVVPERIAAIVRGIAQACELTGTALVGGETAEHPGLMGADDYDVAGAAVGVVEADAVLGAERVRPGDVLIGLAASGLHSNGYSLVRAVVAACGRRLTDPVEELGCTLGEELLRPTRLYARACLNLAGRLGPDLHALAHVTGGGLAANLVRVLPTGLDALVERTAWTVPPIFRLIGDWGQVPWADLERTLNLGVGMVAVVAGEAADLALTELAGAGLDPVIIGHTAANGELESYFTSAEAADVVASAKGHRGGRVVLTGVYS